MKSEIAYTKAKLLIEAGCHFSEFGTRRRRSFQAQDTVVQALIQASKDVVGRGGLSGTSNVCDCQVPNQGNFNEAQSRFTLPKNTT